MDESDIITRMAMDAEDEMLVSVLAEQSLHTALTYGMDVQNVVPMFMTMIDAMWQDRRARILDGVNRRIAAILKGNGDSKHAGDNQV